MPATIVTPEDLEHFKSELLEEIEKRLAKINAIPVRKWLKSAEVRKLLSLSHGTLANLRVNGTLPYTRIGSVIFYNHDDIQKMLEDNSFNGMPLRNKNEAS